MYRVTAFLRDRAGLLHAFSSIVVFPDEVEGLLREHSSHFALLTAEPA